MMNSYKTSLGWLWLNQLRYDSWIQTIEKNNSVKGNEKEAVKKKKNAFMATVMASVHIFQFFFIFFIFRTERAKMCLYIMQY